MLEKHFLSATKRYLTERLLRKRNMDIDFVRRIIDWNKLAGNTTEHFNVRQTALYTGMQCEELAEKLHACGLYGTAAELDRVGKELKQGTWDCAVRDCNRKEALDADADILVVTVGSAMSQGADFHGTMNAVLGANEAKKFPDGMLHKDANGKIVKPEGWKPADLTPYLGRG